MPESSVDYIIVGQGIAGTCLAYTLINDFNQKILVIDEESGKHCSRLSAGVFNPMVIRTLSPVWKADILIPFLEKYYAGMEKNLSCKLLKETPVFRMFSNELMKKDWMKKSLDVNSAPFMDEKIVDAIPGVKGKSGFGVVKQSGTLNTSEMLDGFRNFLQSKATILTDRFKYEDLVIDEEKVRYGNIRAKSIIFCEGHGFRKNPFFGKLPFRETGGDILVIRSTELSLPGIIHNKINIVPMGDHKFWVGSTFRKEFSAESERESHEKLVQQLDATLSTTYEILYTASGIRPTVIDRRPVIGRHAKHKNVFIFNGMGSRGIMLAPYFSMQMAKHILAGGVLDVEADVARFSESG